MKKILMALAATTAIAAAVPATAQPWRGDNNDHRYDQRHDQRYGGNLSTAYVDSLGWKISNAQQERRISRQEARDLQNLLRQVQPIAWRVQSGQAGGWERQRLQNAVDRIEQAVNSRGRRDGRWNDRDYGSGYGRDYRR